MSINQPQNDFSLKDIVTLSDSLRHNKPNTMIFSTLKTPIGETVFAVTDLGLCYLEFYDHTNLLHQIKSLLKQTSSTVVIQENYITDQVKTELNAYFSAHLDQFTIPLDIVGTPFQKETWQTLQMIPYGQTCSYQTQANLMNRPTSVRAVANANGQNKISIIIPCHRVIGSNGQLTGYSSGLWRKEWFLKHELSF